MSAAAHLIGVDWGTSALRLWLMDRDGAVLAERRSDQGMGRLQSNEFAGVLAEHLAALAVPISVPVLICGMAGAQQGWLQAPYVDCPVLTADFIARAVKVPDQKRDIRILPGLAVRDFAEPDVMRGEETKLLGVCAAGLTSGLLCMPGTHTKWVTLAEGSVRTFRTTMSGELFAVLSEHSILRLSVDAAHPSNNPRSPAFVAGVTAGLHPEGGLIAALFQLRAGSLLFDWRGADTADRLSGLLIGAAVREGLAPGEDRATVILIADPPLAGLYTAAIEHTGRAVRTVPAAEAVRHGLILAARQLWPDRS